MTKHKQSSSLSDFVRNAPSEEKERVYGRVLKNATERQKRVTKAPIAELESGDGEKFATVGKLVDDPSKCAP